MPTRFSPGKHAAFRVAGPSAGRYPRGCLVVRPACSLDPQMVAMKIRSCVLVACMVVVPAMALFSHLTPPAAREFLRCSVCDPLCEAISLIDAALPFGSAATLSGGPTASAPSQTGSAAERVAITAESVVPAEPRRQAAATPPAINAVATQLLPVATIAEAATPASASAGRDPPRSQAEWAALASLRKQLADFGATSIDCRPQPGAAAGYSSSCRLGIDAAGQLYRMFHGQGADAPAAMQSLVEQIRAWRVQQAGSPRQRF